MPAGRTIARPPLSGSVTVRIPEEYRSYSLEIIVLPMVDDAALGAAPSRLYWTSADDADAKENADKELKGLAGTWVEDPVAEKAFDEMRNTIDWEMWK